MKTIKEIDKKIIELKIEAERLAIERSKSNIEDWDIWDKEWCKHEYFIRGLEWVLNEPV